ncbi:unnamed protein product [Toxocara canis]|uniref:BMERB domain-containing protein n=1 Tax=Toxocara canis TaxID=6265 RepID=A0A183TZG5_TOXCA|nr:unnamed protein product [Toxocara canis]
MSSSLNVIYHRKCFKCQRCDEILRHGLFRHTKGGFECIQHWPIVVLSHEKLKSSQHPKTKPPPPPKPKNLTNPGMRPTFVPEIVYEEVGDNDSSTTGEVSLPKLTGSGKIENDGDKPTLNSEKMTGGAKDEKNKHVPIVSDNSFDNKIAVMSGNGEQETVLMRPIEDKLNECTQSSIEAIPDDPSSTPIPPPRPKRKSILMSAPHSPLRTPGRPSDKPVALPRLNADESISTKDGSRSASPKSTKAISVVDYPGFLNPFGSDDEESADESDSYDESLNPFGSDSDREAAGAAAEMTTSSIASLSNPSAGSGGRSPVASLPGVSSRPKLQPPPPPKPPRPLLEAANSQCAVITLPRSRNSYLPAIPSRREIIFSENEYDDLELEPIMDRVRSLDKELELVEVNGKCIEKELLFTIEQNGAEWVKNRRVDDWIDTVEKRCELGRQQSAYIMKWLEKYLNDIHSDTEYQLRCLIESLAEKTSSDVEREAKLLELLVEIINQKNRLVESRIDSSALIDSVGKCSSSKGRDFKEEDQEEAEKVTQESEDIRQGKGRSVGVDEVNYNTFIL